MYSKWIIKDRVADFFKDINLLLERHKLINYNPISDLVHSTKNIYSYVIHMLHLTLEVTQCIPRKIFNHDRYRSIRSLYIYICACVYMNMILMNLHIHLFYMCGVLHATNTCIYVRIYTKSSYLASFDRYDL